MNITETTAATRREIATAWLANFNAALDQRDYHRAASMFADECYWRDLLAFTWDIRTFQGQHQVELGLSQTHADSGVGTLELEDREPVVGTIGEYGEVIEVFFVFSTDIADGRGFLRLMPDPQEPSSFKAFTFLTALNSLKDFPERIRRERPRENLHAPERGVDNWLDRRIKTSKFEDRDPEVVVIGAGQAGFTLAARLGQLNVSTLVVDKIDRIGDNWRKRYHSLTLHNELCVNHMPYMPFPETWPVYIPKDMLADWFEFYAKSMELNVWTSTEFLGGEYDEQDKRWTVRLRLADGSVRTMRPSHVVMAVGVTGVPKVPVFPGAEIFRGQIQHTSGDTDNLEGPGKVAVVIGSGTSAHDIAQDLYLRGADVTMLQRSSTSVVSLEPSAARVFTLFSSAEDIRPLDDTDLMSVSVPNELMRRIHIPLSKVMAEDDRELLDGLRRVGFALDNGEDDSGFYMKLVRYFGGYYINVGASDLIVDGKIKLKQGVGVDHLTETEVVFTDGSKIAADILILATGYQPLQEAVRTMLGDEVAERVGPIWGQSFDGELRAMWSRTGQENLYVLGGSFAFARIYSRFVALQIKAAIEGLIQPKRTVDFNADEPSADLENAL